MSCANKNNYMGPYDYEKPQILVHTKLEAESPDLIITVTVNGTPPMFY